MNDENKVMHALSSLSRLATTSQNNKLVLFLARSLDHGGAERQLVTLALGLARRGHRVAVAVFYGGGPFAAELEASGVRLFVLDKQGRWDVLPFLTRLVRLVREERPAVLHGYLGVPNIIAAVLKPLLPGLRVVWGVRASNMDLDRYDWLSRASYRIECWLSRFADLIICNSRAGLEYAAGHGFPREKMTVIPNGIDTERFKPDAGARESIRKEWGITESEILIGLAARLDPMKDHPNFLRAAAMLIRERPHIRFVCVGDGPESYKTELHRLVTGLGMDEKIIWAGVRNDMAAVFNALDIASSSSFGEGFSNTVAEAMACGLPCVVTDVGDSAWIVGSTGFVVPSRDPQALANALIRLVALPADQRCALGVEARARVMAKFGTDKLVNVTEQILFRDWGAPPSLNRKKNG